MGRRQSQTARADGNQAEQPRQRARQAQAQQPPRHGRYTFGHKSLAWGLELFSHDILQAAHPASCTARNCLDGGGGF